MADRLAGGNLDAVLAELRSEGLSYEAIAGRLFASYGIEASAPTVGAWLRALEPSGDAA
jgi:hypothetical protein